VLYPGVVTIREVPAAHERECFIAVEGYGALCKLLIVIDKCTRVVDFDAAQGVGHVLEAIEICHGDVVNTLVNDVFDRLNHQWHTTVRHRGVDLGVPVAGDFDPGVTHDRHDLYAAAV